MASKNQIIEKEITTETITRFLYRKAGCTLDFKLYTHDNKQLKTYKELLQKAIIDIDESLKDFDN